MHKSCHIQHTILQAKAGFGRDSWWLTPDVLKELVKQNPLLADAIAADASEELKIAHTVVEIEDQISDVSITIHAPASSVTLRTCSHKLLLLLLLLLLCSLPS
jgi:hypothetical protein